MRECYHLICHLEGVEMLSHWNITQGNSLAQEWHGILEVDEVSGATRSQQSHEPRQRNAQVDDGDE